MLCMFLSTFGQSPIAKLLFKYKKANGCFEVVIISAFFMPKLIYVKDS
jgi:hypothetical protein